MADNNVELFRRWVEAFNSRDVEAVVAWSHPGIECHSRFSEVDGAVYYGHDGLRAWHQAFADTWAEFRVEIEAYFDLGEKVLGFAVLHGRGRHSGLEVAELNAAVVRSHEDLISYFKSYGDREVALAELGVTHADLEPIAP